METQKNIEEIISSCNAVTVRQSVGRLLDLPVQQLRTVIEEFQKCPDIRFGDNLLDACLVVERMMIDQWQLFSH